MLAQLFTQACFSVYTKEQHGNYEEVKSLRSPNLPLVVTHSAPRALPVSLPTWGTWLIKTAVSKVDFPSFLFLAQWFLGVKKRCQYG